MSDQISPADEERYRAIVFLKAVVPVLRPIVEARPELARGFAGLDGVVQISALTPGAQQDRLATHLILEDGRMSVSLKEHPAPNLELQFGSTAKLNAFFTGHPALPRIRGAVGNGRLLVATVRSLLAMSSLLGATEPPPSEADQELLTRCMFYLLTTGISQLNRAGHPKVRAWSEHQPDRVYQLEVEGRDDLAAYIRVKGGRTKSARGPYRRTKPFFSMSFDTARSALGILLGVDDMVESTVTEKLVMKGAPEYGAELGELMELVGSYAK